MTRDQQPSSMHLRMSPQLHATLRDAAQAAGCSLNAFAIQILSAAAGDAAEFRIVDETHAPRDPVPVKQSWRTSMARSDFIRYMSVEIGAAKVMTLMQRLDVEDPGHYLEWWYRREAGEIPREPDFSHGRVQRAREAPA